MPTHLRNYTILTIKFKSYGFITRHRCSCYKYSILFGRGSQIEHVGRMVVHGYHDMLKILNDPERS